MSTKKLHLITICLPLLIMKKFTTLENMSMIGLPFKLHLWGNALSLTFPQDRYSLFDLYGRSNSYLYMRPNGQASFNAVTMVCSQTSSPVREFKLVETRTRRRLPVSDNLKSNSDCDGLMSGNSVHHVQ
jgi:hypothetical protein